MWYDRLMHIVGLIDHIVGHLVGGESTKDGREAVRTELPFSIENAHEGTDAGVGPTLRDGAELLAVNMDFSGRADLVLALVNASGEAPQVVDLKTRGSLKTFNEKNLKKDMFCNASGPIPSMSLPRATRRCSCFMSTDCNSHSIHSFSKRSRIANQKMSEEPCCPQPCRLVPTDALFN